MEVEVKLLPCCEKCDDLKPTADVTKLYAEDRLFHQCVLVSCEDIVKCESIYNRIKDELQKKP